MTKKHPDIVWSDHELMTWRPHEQLLPSEWAEKYIFLGDYAEEKGWFRLRRTPYAGPILDAFVDPAIEEIVFQKSAQVAGSTIMLLAGAYFAHQEPCPMGFVLADQLTASYMCTDRFQVLFDDSEALEGIKGRTWNDGEMKTTNGAYMVFLWASSVQQLGTKSLRIMCLDEIDKPGYAVKTKEASSLSLAGERKETFFRFKLFKTSTPTLDSGNIAREIESCDVVYDWHVPCHKCGVYQPLRWSPKYATGFKNGRYRDEKGKMRKLGGVVWKGGEGATDRQIALSRYQCGSCDAKWTTVQKNLAVERGKMVPRTKEPKTRRKVGYHVNRIYSLLGKSGDLAKLVRAFIDVIKSNDPKKLQGFVNSTIGEEWKETLRKTEPSEILKARCDLEPRTVPRVAVALTCGVDVQKLGFWYTVWAFSTAYTSWLIDYGYIGQWADVEDLLFNRRYEIDGIGKTAGIWRAGIDTGGGVVYDDMASQTEQTYWFLRKNGIGRGARVWGTKGSAHPLPSKVRAGNVIDKTPSGKPLKGGIQLMMLNTDMLKSSIHYRLDQAVKGGPMAAYLHKKTGEDFAKQIAAEELRINDKGEPEWIVVSRENHLLDCSCIAHAIAEPEWFGGVSSLKAAETQPEEGGRKEPKKGGKSRERW